MYQSDASPIHSATLRGPETGTILLLLLIGVLLGGCYMPRDPENTQREVSGGTMHVGITRNAAPWAWMKDGQAHGVEAELMRRFARRMDAQVKWVPGTETNLLETLERFELDVVIGGLHRSSPWRNRIGFTRRYHTSRLMIGLPEGMNAVKSLSGREIAVEAHTPAVRLVRERDGHPVALERRATQLVAAPDWRLEQWGYEPAEPILQRNRHVLAVPPGENRWLMTLERFLHAQRGNMDELIRSQAGASGRAARSHAIIVGENR